MRRRSSRRSRRSAARPSAAPRCSRAASSRSLRAVETRSPPSRTASIADSRSEASRTCAVWGDVIARRSLLRTGCSCQRSRGRVRLRTSDPGKVMSMSANGDLATYLKDHYAGSAGGTELCRRIADSAAGGDEARDVHSIADAIEEDQKSPRRDHGPAGRLAEPLQGARRMGRREGRPPEAAGVGRGGPRPSVRGDDHGGHGKAAALVSLQAIEPQVPELKGPELAELTRRAEDQRSRLQRWHDTAAANLSG